MAAAITATISATNENEVHGAIEHVSEQGEPSAFWQQIHAAL
jgi:hypothetical protein